MKKARTKKSRGLKRKSPQEPAEAREKQAHSKTAHSKTLSPTPAQTKPQQKKSTATQVAKVKVAAKNVAAKNERPAPASNILKTRSAPQQTMRSNVSNGATTNAEVDRWISLIREGGLDRKVKVKGKTGALLVR